MSASWIDWRIGEQNLYSRQEIRTDLSPLELASKVAPLVREAVESVQQSLGAELEFDIFLVLDGREVRFLMEPV